jgi:hypothetical protein
VRGRRALAALVLVAALAGLAADYAATAPDRDPAPAETAVAADYDAHVGERIALWATVRAVGPDGIVVASDAGRLTVVGSEATVAPGDAVQVVGRLRPERRLAAERVVVSGAPERRYMFAVSGLAALVAAGWTLARWRPDRARLALVARDREPPPGDEP